MNIPVFDTFHRLGLFYGKQIFILGRQRHEFFVIINNSPYFHHPAKLSTAKIIVDHCKFPLEFSWPLFAGMRISRLGKAVGASRMIKAQ
jgi:hypothetical protein